MQTEYFVIEASANNSHPMLAWDEYIVGFGRPEPVAITKPVPLRLGSPVPHNPVMVDHHSLPDPVVSTRIRDLLEPMDLHGLQIVAADVKVTPDDVRRYWLLHVYNEIACIDRDRSKLSIDDDDGGVLGIDKLVLDERVLQEISLEQRLLFALAESVSVKLFHHSLVERILTLQPEGLRFVRADQWNDSAGFRP